jgi:sortase A
MISPMAIAARRRRVSLARTGLLLLVAGAPLLAAACSSASAEEQATTTRAAVTSTTARPTTTTTVPRTTTTSSTTTTSTSTTTTTTLTTSTTTTTTAAPPPQQAAPIAPPADTNTREPVIELGRLLIPKLGVDMVMYEGIRMPTLDRGPGHWPGTAMPGQPGNVVVAGHRTSKHKVFRYIDRLVPGDEIIFEDAAGRHVYRVNRTEVVWPDAVWIVNPTATPTATLFACHPPGSVRQRIVVFADLVTA